jgi:hypothetical protein
MTFTWVFYKRMYFLSPLCQHCCLCLYFTFLGTLRCSLFLVMSCLYWLLFCNKKACPFSFVLIWCKKMPQHWIHIHFFVGQRPPCASPPPRPSIFVRLFFSGPPPCYPGWPATPCTCNGLRLLSCMPVSLKENNWNLEYTFTHWVVLVQWGP